MKTLFVAGTFDDLGGRPSGYAEKLVHNIADSAYKIDDKSAEYMFYNGGKYDVLETLLKLVLLEVDSAFDEGELS